MIYKDFEIYARVHKSMSDLYSVLDNGDLGESMDVLIDNHVDDVVWYETDADHVLKSDHFPRTLDECKAAIDKYLKENPIEELDLG